MQCLFLMLMAFGVRAQESTTQLGTTPQIAPSVPLHVPLPPLIPTNLRDPKHPPMTTRIPGLPPNLGITSQSSFQSSSSPSFSDLYSSSSVVGDDNERRCTDRSLRLYLMHGWDLARCSTETRGRARRITSASHPRKTYFLSRSMSFSTRTRRMCKCKSSRLRIAIGQLS